LREDESAPIQRLQSRREAQKGTVVPTGFFVAGYLTVWTAFSAACAGLQQFLHARALLSPRMASTSFVFSARLLMAVGVYQWTPMKECLSAPLPDSVRISAGTVT